MAEAGWTRVASKSDVKEGAVLGVRVGKKDVALYHLPGGEFCATDVRSRYHAVGGHACTGSSAK